jgi:hypothetical protein
MSDSTSLRRRLRADLTDDLSVTVTAVGLGVAAFLLTALEVDALWTILPASAELAPTRSLFGPTFLLSLSLMDIAFVYGDHWPVTYPPVYAVLWTILLGLITAGVFVSVYQLALSQTGSTAAGAAAFLVAVGVQYASAVLYARAR